LEQQIFKYSRETSISTAVGPYTEHDLIKFGMIQKLWPMLLLQYIMIWLNEHEKKKKQGQPIWSICCGLDCKKWAFILEWRQIWMWLV